MARSFTDVTTDAITTTNTFTVASSGTVGGWYKPAFSPGDGVQRYFGWDTVSTQDAPSCQRFQDNNFYVGFTNAGNTRVVVADTGLFTSGTWIHVALSWTSSLQTFYLNGVSKGSQAFTFSSPGALQMRIANSGSGAVKSFAGSVADFAVWNITLTANELVAISKGARPRDIRGGPSLLWYPVDGLVSPEPDFSGNANNGTLTGTAKASGPPVMQFTPRWNQFNFVAAASFNPAWALGRNQFIEGFAS